MGRRGHGSLAALPLVSSPSPLPQFHSNHAAQQTSEVLRLSWDEHRGHARGSLPFCAAGARQAGQARIPSASSAFGDLTGQKRVHRVGREVKAGERLGQEGGRKSWAGEIGTAEGFALFGGQLPPEVHSRSSPWCLPDQRMLRVLVCRAVRISIEPSRAGCSSLVYQAGKRQRCNAADPLRYVPTCLAHHDGRGSRKPLVMLGGWVVGWSG